MKPRIGGTLGLLAFCTFLFYTSSADPVVYGLLPEKLSSISDGVSVIPSNQPVVITLFGTNLDSITHIGFATRKELAHSDCEHGRETESFELLPKSNPHIATSVINLRELAHDETNFYLCFRFHATDQSSDSTNVALADNATELSESWVYAGPKEKSEELILLRTTKSLLPLWVQIILIIVLFCLSGLFSGLNLGLMSLNKTELKIIETAGSPNEKMYAKAISPIRAKGNLLLCTLLLGNVLVNTSLTILMDDLTGSGMVAVIASTIGITMFGEIMPQAVCSRHGLAIGARTLILTKFFMVLTFPIAFPISFILDKILGEEIGQVYDRDKLGVLMREQALAGAVATDELKIITGALAITTKTVEDVMTPLQDAFMLSSTDVLDFHTMNSIHYKGYTRIPVYENDRQNIRAVLNVKDLVFLGVEQGFRVSTLCDFSEQPILIVRQNTNLLSMLKEFKQGRTHMAFIERLVTEEDRDPYRELIGLVTLEDVIEEIIQAEIVDETDILLDNKHHQRRNVRRRGFDAFSVNTKQQSRLSPQLKIAALRFLSTSVEEFSEKYISYSVLQSLLNADIVCEKIYNPMLDQENVLYERHTWANYAILIVQGRAGIRIGAEDLQFEVGPFMFFGEVVFQRVNDKFQELNNADDASKQSAILAAEGSFVPDYTLKACTNMQYIRISAEQYFFARHLSVLEYRSKPMVQPALPAYDSVCINREWSPDSDNEWPLSAGQPDLFERAWERRMMQRHQVARDTMETDVKYPTALDSNKQKSDLDVTFSGVNIRDHDSNNTVLSKRNSALVPNSGDIRNSQPDEMQPFVLRSDVVGSDPTTKEPRTAHF